MKIEVPDFLIELSKQMNSDPNRATAHPFWQVRCKRYAPTAEEFNEHHYELFDSDNQCQFYRSDKDEDAVFLDYLITHHAGWVEGWSEYSGFELDPDEPTAKEYFVENFTSDDFGELPECIDMLPMQEIDEVVSTHLTQAAAEQFIARKQHDYPQLYTYVESAYWSPQLVELQDWIKSLTEDENDENEDDDDDRSDEDWFFSPND